eukprot:jgi/Mesen1/5899/ME000003S06930
MFMASSFRGGPLGPLFTNSASLHQGLPGLSSAIRSELTTTNSEAKQWTGPVYNLGDLAQPLNDFCITESRQGGQEGLEAIAKEIINQQAPPGASAIRHQILSQLAPSPPTTSADSRASVPKSSAITPPPSRLEHWEDRTRIMSSPGNTEASNDMDADKAFKEDAHNNGGQGGNNSGGGGNSSDQDQKNGGDSKMQSLRRLAQNREAARKSRLRKKAYVQQLESSRIRLQQLEHELQRARSQGFPGSGAEGGGASASVPGGVATANVNPGRGAQYSKRGAAVGTGRGRGRERQVDGVMAHYDELFRMKSQAAKADVFHLVSGMWKTPAERCFMWMGGFRPSELLKILIPQIEPLTEQQLLGICNLQQSSQQAEDALSQGMEALQQSLADTLSAGSLGASSNVANYMGQMAMAMGKLGTLESFADSLRQQTLQQMHRILTCRQAARGLLAMGDYFARLRALSSLWSARPRE